MPVTLKDIAKAAGVSITTVSMVLRENPHPMISKQTRQRVLDVAGALKYRHNLHARTLRMGKSQTIGLLTFDLENRIVLSKLEAVDRRIWARGYRSLMRNAAGHADMEQQYIRELASSALEGLIVVQTASHDMSKVLEPLLYGDIKVVTLEPLEGTPVDCVTVDRRYGAYIAVNHLLKLGHRRIGMLHASPFDLHTGPRLEGYREALAEYGIEPDEKLLIGASRNYEGGYKGVKALLKEDLGVTAVFCNNDEVAIGAMKAIGEAGLRIPEDIAVVGFDNIDAGEYAPVPLTTVAQPVDDLADKAVEMLFKRLESEGGNQPVETVYLKPSLVIRDSCGGARKEIKD